MYFYTLLKIFMISVLIPTYNYNVNNLVNNVHKQLVISHIPFEIICLDDCSNIDPNVPVFEDFNNDNEESSINFNSIACSLLFLIILLIVIRYYYFSKTK